MKLWAIPLSLVAGWGHIYLRRYVLGTALFVLFAAAANAFLLSFLWLGGDGVAQLRAVSFWALVLLLGLSVAHVLYLAIFLGRPAVCRQRTALLEEALTEHLRGRLVGARRALQTALSLCPDPHDADVFFLLGALAAHEGSARRALRYFRRCERFDERRKWREEIDRQRARLRLAKTRPLGGMHRPDRASSRAPGRVPIERGSERAPRARGTSS